MEHHSDEYSQSHAAGSPKIGWYTILAMQSLLISVNVTVIVIGHMHLLDNTAESRDYIPPLCMLALGKSEAGLIRGILTFPLPTIEYHVGTQSLYFLWLFDGQYSRKSKVRHTMAQIASLLVVATVFIGLCLHFMVREGWGLYERQKYICKNLC